MNLTRLQSSWKFIMQKSVLNVRKWWNEIIGFLTFFILTFSIIWGVSKLIENIIKVIQRFSTEDIKPAAKRYEMNPQPSKSPTKNSLTDINKSSKQNMNKNLLPRLLWFYLQKRIHQKINDRKELLCNFKNKKKQICYFKMQASFSHHHNRRSIVKLVNQTAAEAIWVVRLTTQRSAKLKGGGVIPKINS